MNIQDNLSFNCGFIRIKWNKDNASIDFIQFDLIQKLIKNKSEEDMILTPPTFLDVPLIDGETYSSFFQSSKFDSILKYCLSQPKFSVNFLRQLSQNQNAIEKEIFPCLFFAFLAPLIPRCGLQFKTDLFPSISHRIYSLSLKLNNYHLVSSHDKYIKYLLDIQEEDVLNLENESEINFKEENIINLENQPELNFQQEVFNYSSREQFIFEALKQILSDANVLHVFLELMYNEKTSDFIFLLIISWINTYSETILPLIANLFPPNFEKEDVLNYLNSPTIIHNLTFLFFHIFSSISYRQMKSWFLVFEKFFPYNDLEKFKGNSNFYLICYLTFFCRTYRQCLRVPKQDRHYIFDDDLEENEDEHENEDENENEDEHELENEYFYILDNFYDNLQSCFYHPSLAVIFFLLDLFYPLSKQFTTFKNKWKVILYGFIDSIPDDCNLQQKWYLDFKGNKSDEIENESDEIENEINIGNLLDLSDLLKDENADFLESLRHNILGSFRNFN